MGKGNVVYIHRQKDKENDKSEEKIREKHEFRYKTIIMTGDESLTHIIYTVGREINRNTLFLFLMRTDITTFKQIELEGPGCSRFVENLTSFKT